MALSTIDIEELEEALKHVAPSGKFATGAKIANLDLRCIEIRWLGQILLPLCLEGVAALRGRCEQAPYGRGMHTVVDTSVRRAWQIDGRQVTLPGVEAKIQQLANASAKVLGINTDSVKIKPLLYKLVFYEEGGHFVKHRDTEKEPGMFGTMVLQCPVAGGHTGGEFYVWHKGQQESFNFSAESSESFFSTAFFADCEHELKPIRSGYRLCLIFNLVREQSVFSLPPSDLLQMSAALPLAEAALQPWRDAASISRNCPKFAILLEHQYTEQNLSFSNLKGRDRVTADVLRCVRDSENNPMLELHLALLTKHETGTTEYSPPRRRGFWGFDKPSNRHHIMDEVHETSIKLKNWIAVDDTPFGGKGRELDFDIDSELVPPGDPFENSDPDKEDYEDYTGNAGPTLEYWYHAAVLVIWPRCKTVEILRREFNTTAFIDLLERKQREQSPELPGLLSGAIDYLRWNPIRISSSSIYSSDPKQKSPCARLMQLAVDLNSEADATKLVEIASPLPRNCPSIKGFVDSGFAEAIGTAIRAFTWERLGERVLRLITPLNLAIQFEYIVRLYDSVDVYNKAAALEIAQKVFREVSTANPEICLNGKWGLLLSLLLKIDGCIEFGARYMRSVLPRLKTSDLNAMLSLAIRLSQQGTNVLNETPKAELVKEITRLLLAKPFALGDEAIIANIARNLYWLNDENFVQRFRQQILSSPNCSQLLPNLLKDVSGLLSVNPSSGLARASLPRLIADRIAQLEGCRPPTFSWHMPKANFPRHPQVEAFLRGPEAEFVYCGLSGIGHARNFANKYFNGSYQDGYSGVGEPGGRGSGAFCKIKKTRATFKVLEDEYRNGLEELERLRQTLVQIQRNSQGPVTTTIPAPEASPSIVNEEPSTSSAVDLIILD